MLVLNHATDTKTTCLFLKIVNVFYVCKVIWNDWPCQYDLHGLSLIWTELCDFWRESIKIYKSVMASSIVNYIRYVITMGFSVHP